MLLLSEPIEIPLAALGARMSLYRDHADPRLFHFLPGPPRLVITGDRAGLSLLRYRGAGQGGLLSIDAELRWPEAALAAARAELAGRIGAEPNLVPALFCEGSVRLCLLDAGQDGATFVEQIIGAATPSLLGRQRAIFSVALSAEGASLISQALIDPVAGPSSGPGPSAGPEPASGAGQAPLLLCYELALRGLRPARALRVSLHYHMAYHHLRARMTAGTLWLRADLDREIEALRKEGAIEVEDIAYADTDPALAQRRQEEILTTLRELLESVLLRPATSPSALDGPALARAPQVAAAWHRAGQAQATFALRDLRQDESQVLRYDLREATVFTQRIAPQGSLRLPDGLRAADHVRDVTLGDGPVPSQVRLFCPPQGSWRGVSQIIADLRAGDEVRSVVLSPDSPQGQVVLPPGPIDHRLRLHRADGATAPEPAWGPLPALDLAIDPSGLAGLWPIEVALGVVDAAAIERVDVRLSQPDRPDQLFALRPGSPGADCLLQAALPAQVNATLHQPHGAGQITLSPQLATGQQLLVINQPAGLFQVVTLMLQDPLSRYSAVVVELEPLPQGPRRAVQLDNEHPVVAWSFSTAPGEAGRYRHRVQRIGKDGGAVQGPWLESQGGLLLCGDLDLRLQTVTGAILGERAGQHQGALLRLVPKSPPQDGPDSVEVMLDPGQVSFALQVPLLRAAPPLYRVELQLFFDEGEQRVDLPDQDAEIMLISLPAAS